jgi:hypothetical protein
MQLELNYSAPTRLDIIRLRATSEEAKQIRYNNDIDEYLKELLKEFKTNEKIRTSFNRYKS